MSDEKLVAPAYVEEGAQIEMEEVIPVVYGIDLSAINSFEDLREFIKEMNITFMVLPWDTLESKGKNPRLWKRIGVAKITPDGRVIVEEDNATPPTV